ncbi:BCCT family transporter [Biformimicrobium ophioploci]|uniref:BCCT family transporter n=1 Tax=Biformimicrobium ophioploci TaxID=3036711 RepID=A0ABQ6LVN5_9GAMM|nr:BCCT family transporter [Microbulbifer sp. NKW57]GMG86135.1 BCCT family transporter [Microbulbifer sp. NKW57]
MKKHSVDKPAFAFAAGIIFLVCIPLVLSPETGGAALKALHQWITRELGQLYILAANAVLVFLGWLAFGRYGKVKLGDASDVPDYSNFTWVGMLFCAGIGAGLMYWAAIEWAYYYEQPPMGAEPGSAAALRWASSYGIFHWGPSAWAFYCLPAVAIAYPYYVKKVPLLRFSTGMHAFLGHKPGGIAARGIDLMFMLALLGGAGSSLGFSTPMISAGISRLTGIEQGFGLDAAVVVLSIAIFVASVFFGLERGFRKLSGLSVRLAIGLLLFILIAGPTAFLIKSGINALGNVMQNFVAMSTWTEPFADSGFVEDWTMFYWAWWIAFAPFVGLFVTRISRGRTLRQVIVGMLVFGSLGCSLFYIVLGNLSLYHFLQGNVDVVAILGQGGGKDVIVAVLDQLPLAALVIALFSLVSILFSATTYDSAALALAGSATRELPIGENPARWHRISWALMLGVLPITLLFVGGLTSLQTVLLVVALPILVICVLMAISLVRSLQAGTTVTDNAAPETVQMSADSDMGHTAVARTSA